MLDAPTIRRTQEIKLGSCYEPARKVDDRGGPVLFALEDEARAAKRGLWALPEAQRTPPWEWRQASRAAKPRSSSTDYASLSCGSKRTCKQMADCVEARFYLNSCGLTRLDGDGDGTPCEAICR